MDDYKIRKHIERQVSGLNAYLALVTLEATEAAPTRTLASSDVALEVVGAPFIALTSCRRK